MNVHTHPAYPVLVEHYRAALTAWQSSAGVRDAAGTFGVSQREYCDRYIGINFQPVTWAGTDTAGQEWTQAHYDAAYDAALAEIANPHRALAVEGAPELKPPPAWAYRPLRPDEYSRVAEGAGDPLPQVTDSELAAMLGDEGQDTDDDWETVPEGFQEGNPHRAIAAEVVAGCYEEMRRREEAGA